MDIFEMSKMENPKIVWAKKAEKNYLKHNVGNYIFIEKSFVTINFFLYFLN